MKKTGIILILVLFTLFKAEAQYVRGDSARAQNARAQQSTDFWSHTSIGGNFGLEFGTTTIVAISPLLNFHPTSKFVIGLGPMYQYYNIEDPYYGVQITGSIYGGRVSAQYYLPGNPDGDDRASRIISNIFVAAEYDLLNVPYQSSINYETARTTIGVPLVGLGFRERIGQMSGFMVSCMWDLSGSPLSPYYSNPTFPVILAGFDFGL